MELRLTILVDYLPKQEKKWTPINRTVSCRPDYDILLRWYITLNMK